MEIKHYKNTIRIGTVLKEVIFVFSYDVEILLGVPYDPNHSGLGFGFRS